MDLLLVPAVVVLATNFVRYLIGKYGTKTAQAIALVTAFVISGLAALFFHFLPLTLWQEAVTIFGIQMSVYEVVWKRVLKPVFDSVFTD